MYISIKFSLLYLAALAVPNPAVDLQTASHGMNCLDEQIAKIK